MVLFIALWGFPHLFWAQAAGTPDVPNKDVESLANQKLSLCSIRVEGISQGKPMIAGNLLKENWTYFAEFTKEIDHIYETALAERGSIDYVFGNALGGEQFNQRGNSVESTIATFRNAGNDLSSVAKANRLYACISANSVLVAKMGLKKRLLLKTKWEVIDATGHKFKTEISSVSQDSYGAFPLAGDPKLKPAYLQLAKDNVQRFMEWLFPAVGWTERPIRPAAPSAQSSPTASAPAAVQTAPPSNPAQEQLGVPVQH